MRTLLICFTLLLNVGCASLPDPDQARLQGILSKITAESNRRQLDPEVQKIVEWQIKVDTLKNGSIQRKELIDKCITIFNYDWVKPTYHKSTRVAYGTEVHGWEVYTVVNYFTGYDHKYAKIVCNFDNTSYSDYIAIRNYKMSYSMNTPYSRRHHISEAIPGITIREKLYNDKT